MSTNKKRVAIYYENRLGRNDGYPLYASNLLKDTEKYPNIEAHHLIPDGNYNMFANQDLNIWIDWGEDGLTQHIPYEIAWPTDAPLCYYASDTHLGKDYRFETSLKADYVFFAQKPAVEEYLKFREGKKHKNKHVQFLPHGVEPRAFPDTPLAPKKYDVSFVGHLVSQERIEVLDAVFRAYPNFWFGRRLSRYVKDEGYADDCADIYRKSRIVVNPPTRNDIAMRTFEATASGAFLLQGRCPALEEIYTDKVHMAMYDTTEEAIELIKYYLEHEEEREKIALAGKERTLATQTYEQRLNTMLVVAGILPKEMMPPSFLLS
jgi:spore maturation protein CgeB